MCYSQGQFSCLSHTQKSLLSVSHFILNISLLQTLSMEFCCLGALSTHIIYTLHCSTVSITLPTTYVSSGLLHSDSFRLVCVY